jgi:hypothetical protein
VAVWTKPVQSSPGIPHSYLLTVGNGGHDVHGGLGGAISIPFTSDDNYDESHKVGVVSLVKRTYNVIAW